MDDDWVYYSVAVSKYNPKYRDENGDYKRDEWMGYSEIGDIFQGKEFNYDEYLEIELKYIKAAKLFLEYEKCNSLIVMDLENYIDEGKFLNQDKDLVPFYNSLEEGKIISVDSLEIIMKIMLRGYVWCNLICQDKEKTSLRYSSDFYLFLVSQNNLKVSILKQKIVELGLFMT